MTRCIYCEKRILPWQNIGWRIGLGSWHPRCRQPTVVGFASPDGSTNDNWITFESITVVGICPACPWGVLLAHTGYLICDHCGFVDNSYTLDEFYRRTPPTERADTGPLGSPTPTRLP
jgi:hypothetical protein